jgi:lysozyme
MTLMTTSNRGKDLIKEFEGLRLHAYLCPAGRWTIGYGHTGGVRKGQVITEDDAERMLSEDCQTAERTLNALGVNFRQEQFDALVSWIFNLGIGNFSASTLRKRILAGAANEQIADEIVRWVNSGGKPLAGLMRRRVREANMFLDQARYKISHNKIVKV